MKDKRKILGVALGDPSFYNARRHRYTLSLHNIFTVFAPLVCPIYTYILVSYITFFQKSVRFSLLNGLVYIESFIL